MIKELQMLLLDKVIINKGRCNISILHRIYIIIMFLRIYNIKNYFIIIERSPILPLCF